MTTRTQEPFDVAMGELFDDLMTDVHTAAPARVISFDSSLQTCVVQPTLKRKYKGSDTAELLPVIEDVPVIFPGSNDLFLTFDLKADSYVLLIFSERAIADWMVQGGEVDPQRKRKHALSDAIAIPGILPTPSILTTVEADTISMRNKLNTANVKVKTDGNVVVNNGVGTALEFARMKAAFDTFINDFDLHTHPAPGGATSPPATPATADMTAAESPTVKVP